MKAADLDFVNEVRNECREYLHDNSEFTLEETKEWFRAAQPKFYLVMKDGKRIGYIRTSTWRDGEGFLVHSKENADIEVGKPVSCFVGCDLHQEYRGMKLSRVVYILLLNYLFEEKELETVWLEVLHSNTRALKLYESLGFKHVSNSFLKDRPEMSITMRLDRNKWLRPSS